MGRKNAKGNQAPAKVADPRVLETQQRVGKRIRALRESRMLTQEALANMAGFTQKYLGEVERGTGNITIELLTKLAAALGVSPASIMENDHEQARDGLVAEISRMAPLLSERDAKTVYCLLKMLTNQ